MDIGEVVNVNIDVIKTNTKKRIEMNIPCLSPPSYTSINCHSNNKSPSLVKKTCNKKVNTSKNMMGFKPLIKKYKRIRENNTVTKVNASSKA